MYGPIKTDKDNENYVSSKELFTGTPSRDTFPRSFFWDVQISNIIY